MSTPAPDLLQALKTACGYMRNAAIGLKTGAPKKAAIELLDSGIRIVTEAIAAAENNEPKSEP